MFDFRVLTLLLAAVPALLLASPGDAGGPSGGPSAAADTQAGPAGPPRLLDGYERLDCTECHGEIAREWAGSYHAKSWVHPRYQAEIKGKRRPQSCHGCHIPAPLHLTSLDRKPPARTETDEPLHFGVSCKSCHLGADGVILGPYGSPTEAHASQASRLFRDTSEGAPTPLAGSNELCAACHRTTIGPVIGVAKDFEVSDQVARGRSCVGCHMDPVYRSMGSFEGTPAEERMGRSHTLNSPRDPDFLRSAFAVSVAAEAGRTVITFVNEAAHRVPGLVDRELTFEARVLDASGAERGQGRIVFTSRSYLPADQSRQLVVEASGDRVSLVGTHAAASLDSPIRFYEVSHTIE